jgi:SAM-dependent methyltransferase
MSGEALLDFGSGPAPYQELFSGFSRYVTADLPGEAAELTIENGLVPADDGAFDAVISTQVLEHVPDPDDYLAEARRLLKPNGRLVLSTHGIYRYHPQPEDLWRWTGPGLRRLLERSGYRVVSQVPVVSAPAAAMTMLSQYAAEALPGRLRPAWHWVSQIVVGITERFSRVLGSTPEDAALFVVVAERSDLRRAND